MTQSSESTTLELPITVENDLEVDNDGRFYLISYLFPDTSEESVGIRILFDDVIDSLLEFYQEETGPSGYGQLYLIANEFERHTDRLREIAGYMEGKHHTGDLFDEF
jgi:hypothetical protein